MHRNGQNATFGIKSDQTIRPGKKKQYISEIVVPKWFLGAL